MNGFCLHACTVVTVIARDESQFTNEVSVLSFLHKKKAEKRLDRSEHPVIWRKSLVIVSHAVASLSIEEPTTRTQNGRCTFRPITNVAEEGKETGLAVATPHARDLGRAAYSWTDALGSREQRRGMDMGLARPPR